MTYTRTGYGPVVLLIQGGDPAERPASPRVSVLEQWYGVVAVGDAIPVEGSTNGVGGGNVDAMVERVLAIMDAEGIERFHIVAHEAGGAVARALAVRAPRRTMSVSVLNDRLADVHHGQRRGGTDGLTAALLEYLLGLEEQSGAGLGPGDGLGMLACRSNVCGRESVPAVRRAFEVRLAR